ERMRKRDSGHFANPSAFPYASKAAAAVAALVEGDDQRAIEGRGKKSARGVAEVMIESFHAVAPATSHRPQNPEVVEFTAEFAGSLIEKVHARNGRERRMSSAKKSFARPCAAGARCDGDSIHVLPLHPGTLQAIADGEARNAALRARASKFSLFDGSDHARVADDSDRRIVLHGGNAENVHVSYLPALVWFSTRAYPAN